MLNEHKVIHEADDHFVVEGKDGKAFKVAKARLAHSTVEKIRGFAKGGEVKGYAEGGEAQSADPSFLSMTTGVPDAPTVPATAPETVNGLTSAAALPPDMAAQLAGVRRSVAVDTSKGIQLSATSPLAPPLAAAPPPQAPAFQLAGVPSSFATGEAETRQGAQQMAEAKSAEAQQIARIQGEANVRKAEATASFEKRMSAHDVAAKALFEDVASSKIDPDQFWATKSTGQKISAAIGLVLGGIGAGLTRGPNFALEMMNKAIDRDMEAQRLNLGKKQNQLNLYVQQGREMQTAYGLAKADHLEMVAGQMAKTAAEFADPKAQAEALLTVGAMRTQAAQLRQQAEAHALAIQQTKIGLEFQQGVIKALRGEMGGGAPDAAKTMLMSTFLGHPEKLAEHQVAVPEERQIGTDKNGVPQYQTMAKQRRLAFDPDSAKKARDGMRATQEQDAKLRQIELFVKQHPVGSWTPAENQRGNSLIQDFKLSWNRNVEGLNRLNTEEVHMVDQMLSNPTGFWASATGKTDSAVKVIRGAIAHRKQAILDEYTFP